MKILIKSLLIVAFLGAAVILSAQDSLSAKGSLPRSYNRGWYLGGQLGMPMSEGTFSSFGADGFRPGWNVGIHLGYRFNSIFSLEVGGNWGQLFMAEQNCCLSRNYFLDVDHWRRYAYPPEGTNGAYYRDLKSVVFAQRYLLQFNINILGFFPSTGDGRWKLEFAPTASAVGTSVDIVKKEDNAPLKENVNNWHFGYGGNMQVSYAVAKNLSLGLYGGFTHHVGKSIDGMPDIHMTNYVIDAGVKVTYAFGSKQKNSSRSGSSYGEDALVDIPFEPVDSAVAAQDVKESASVPVSNQLSLSEEGETKQDDGQGVGVVEQDVAKTAGTVAVADVDPVECVEAISRGALLSQEDIPVIYFSFNSVWIEWGERSKIDEIVNLLNEYPDTRIRVIGWGDDIGTEAQNKKVSLQRAQTVKAALVKKGIDADRISVEGAGINSEAASRDLARNATTIEQL